jgi:hypothetical protein
MAAPAVAGHAVQLRQYLLDGYYPSGAPSLEDSFIPSGALMKAMLIAAAVPMKAVAVCEKNDDGSCKTPVKFSEEALDSYPNIKEG